MSRSLLSLLLRLISFKVWWYKLLEQHLHPISSFSELTSAQLVFLLARNRGYQNQEDNKLSSKFTWFFVLLFILHSDVFWTQVCHLHSLKHLVHNLWRGFLTGCYFWHHFFDLFLESFEGLFFCGWWISSDWAHHFYTLFLPFLLVWSVSLICIFYWFYCCFSISSTKKMFYKVCSASAL